MNGRRAWGIVSAVWDKAVTSKAIPEASISSLYKCRLVANAFPLALLESSVSAGLVPRHTLYMSKACYLAA